MGKEKEKDPIWTDGSRLGIGKWERPACGGKWKDGLRLGGGGGTRPQRVERTGGTFHPGKNKDAPDDELH